MPFFANPHEEEEKQAAGEGAGSETVISGESGTIGASGGAGAAAGGGAKAAAPTRSGSWTNLTSYLDANKGNDQAMADRVKGAVESKAGAATSAGTVFQNNANEAVQKGTVADAGVVQGLKDDPTKVDKEQFKKQSSAVYGGPQGASEVQGWMPAQQAYAGTTDLADMAYGKHAGSSKAGVSAHDQRATALADTSVYGRPSYSQGERQLDSFIMGGGAGGQKTLADIQQGYGAGSKFQTGWTGLLDSVGDVTKADSQIGRAKATTDKTAADTNAAYDAAAAGVDAAVAAARPKVADENAKLTDFIAKGGSGDPETLRAAGFSDRAIDLYQRAPFDLNKHIDKGVQFKLGDFLGDKTVADYKALAGLKDLEVAEDLSKGGGRQAGFKTGTVANVNEAGDLEAKIAEAMKAGAAAPTGLDFADDATKWAAQTGLPPETLQLAMQLGIDPQSFAAVQDVTADDLVDDVDEARWAELMKALPGLGAFDPSQQVSQKAVLDQAKLKQLGELQTLRSSLDARAAGLQEQRNANAPKVRKLMDMGDYISAAELAGTSPTQLKTVANWLKSDWAKNNGVTFDSLLSTLPYSAGSVAGDPEVAQWNAFTAALGATKSPVTFTGQNVNRAVFDDQAIKRFIDAAIAGTPVKPLELGVLGFPLPKVM